MLQAIDIRKNYGDNEILKGVTVRVDKGEVVAVIGRSGSGKSTLLRCLNHLETIDSGEIRIDGQAMVTTGADGAARYRTEKDLRGLCLKMGLVFQDYNLFPHYTVLRNIVAPQQLVLHRSCQEAEQKEDIDIIGQFGVGFYSAFMVADEITVVTKKYGAETAYRWQSSGADGYTVAECEKDSVGTDVIMHLKADTDEEKYSEYLDSW